MILVFPSFCFPKTAWLWEYPSQMKKTSSWFAIMRLRCWLVSKRKTKKRVASDYSVCWTAYRYLFYCELETYKCKTRIILLVQNFLALPPKVHSKLPRIMVWRGRQMFTRPRCAWCHRFAQNHSSRLVDRQGYWKRCFLIEVPPTLSISG